MSIQSAKRNALLHLFLIEDSANPSCMEIQAKLPTSAVFPNT